MPIGDKTGPEGKGPYTGRRGGNPPPRTGKARLIKAGLLEKVSVAAFDDELEKVAGLFSRKYNNKEERDDYNEKRRQEGKRPVGYGRESWKRSGRPSGKSWRQAYKQGDIPPAVPASDGPVRIPSQKQMDKNLARWLKEQKS